MFSSIFSSNAPDAPTFHPVTSAFGPEDFCGELEPKDTEWACAGGFVTETQTWYNILDDGTFFMCQVIYSSIGVWFPTVQFTCKLYNPSTKERVWRSINVSNFASPPPPAGGVVYDKRSSRADEFTIIHNPANSAKSAAESYTINAKVTQDVQLSLVISRPESIPGFKFGRGPKGGFSQFGANTAKPEGYVVHRFWPRTDASGLIVYRGRAITAQGPGMFVHAIQGMRPNLVASRWNFANFQSNEHGGVSAIQMEFTTLPEYGPKGAGSGGVRVNVGGVVVNGKLVLVTGETILPGRTLPDDAKIKSRAIHLDTQKDPDTKYSPPSGLVFEWAGPSVEPGVQGEISAKIELDVGTPASPKGLVEKVDVLAEIPKVVKAVLNYVAGTKPYIYQYLNNVKLTLTVPGDNVEEPKTFDVEGTLFNEATFIS